MKTNIQIGELINSEHSLAIDNDDGTNEYSEPGDMFFVIGFKRFGYKQGFTSYQLIRQKSLKVSSWYPGAMVENFNKVKA